VLVQFVVDHFLRGVDDGLTEFLVELAKRHVGLGGGALDDAERADDRGGLLLPTDLEIAEAALSLRAPIRVCGNVNGALCVGFDASIGHLCSVPFVFMNKFGASSRMGRALSRIFMSRPTGAS
jgi:hypothetical protein